MVPGVLEITFAAGRSPLIAGGPIVSLPATGRVSRSPRDRSDEEVVCRDAAEEGSGVSAQEATSVTA